MYEALAVLAIIGIAGGLLWRYFSRRKAPQAEIVREIEQAIKEGRQFQLLAIGRKDRVWFYRDHGQPNNDWVCKASLDEHGQIVTVVGILQEVSEGIKSKQLKFLGDKCLMFGKEWNLNLWVKSYYLLGS